MPSATPALPSSLSQARFLVEGPDDQGVLLGLLRLHGYGAHLDPKSGPIVVRSVGGINEIPRQFRVLAKGSTISHIGIIVDADNNLSARWQSIRNMLQVAGYATAPVAIPVDGAVITEPGKQPIGIWIMPNNRDAGVLEHFVGELVPRDSDLWPRAKRVVATLNRSGRLVGAPNVVMKAQIHTWLAWQTEPGQPMGLAITKHYFDPNAQYCVDIGNWIQRLFSA